VPPDISPRFAGRRRSCLIAFVRRIDENAGGEVAPGAKAEAASQEICAQAAAKVAKAAKAANQPRARPRTIRDIIFGRWGSAGKTAAGERRAPSALITQDKTQRKLRPPSLRTIVHGDGSGVSLDDALHDR
jgi:hypothetical protein